MSSPYRSPWFYPVYVTVWTILIVFAVTLLACRSRTQPAQQKECEECPKCDRR